MAVRKRGNCYQTVYRCPGEKSSRTELFKTEEEATLRDLQIKLRKKNGTFQPPAKTSKKQKSHQQILLLQLFWKNIFRIMVLRSGVIHIIPLVWD